MEKQRQYTGVACSVLKNPDYVLAREYPKPSLCKGRWAKSLILVGGVAVQQYEFP